MGPIRVIVSTTTPPLRPFSLGMVRELVGLLGDRRSAARGDAGFVPSQL
jgi:hypothetical protein